MFKFVSENNVYPCDESESIRRAFYQFNLTKDDYFLERSMLWDEIRSSVYEFKTDTNELIYIPSGMYVMIGDIYGEVDWIIVEELIGRDLDVLIIKKDFSSWGLNKLTLTNESEQCYYWPMTKNAIPITTKSEPSNMVLISRSDQYKLTQDKTVDCYVS